MCLRFMTSQFGLPVRLSSSIFYFHIKIGKKIGQNFNNIKNALSCCSVEYLYICVSIAKYITCTFDEVAVVDNKSYGKTIKASQMLSSIMYGSDTKTD